MLGRGIGGGCSCPKGILREKWCWRGGRCSEECVKATRWRYILWSVVVLCWRRGAELSWSGVFEEKRKADLYQFYTPRLYRFFFGHSGPFLRLNTGRVRLLALVFRTYELWSVVR